MDLKKKNSPLINLSNKLNEPSWVFENQKLKLNQVENESDKKKKKKKEIKLKTISFFFFFLYKINRHSF